MLFSIWRSFSASKQLMRLSRANARPSGGATGLEPATFGVTGRETSNDIRLP
jgi:hypothetical protein